MALRSALLRVNGPSPLKDSYSLASSSVLFPFQAEAAEARKRVLSTEAEMRDMLGQLEKERELANRRMRQLGAVLGELQTGLMGGETAA